MGNQSNRTKSAEKEPARQSVGTGLEALGSGLNAIGSGLETLGSGVYAVWQGWFSNEDRIPGARPKRSSLASPDDVRMRLADSGEAVEPDGDEASREADALAHLSRQAKVKIIDPNDGPLPSAKRRMK